MPLDIGMDASLFTLQDADELTVSLKDLKGKWVVLYFYPKDNTPGCTIEAIEFTRLRKEFQSKDAIVLGISKDSCGSHKTFIRSQKLSIRLLSDPDTKVMRGYGVWRKKTFMGKSFIGTVRTTFLVDPAGKIAKVWDDVKPKGHAQEVLTELQRQMK
jgi:peroxiredoxin Q/BCP